MALKTIRRKEEESCVQKDTFFSCRREILISFGCRCFLGGKFENSSFSRVFLRSFGEALFKEVRFVKKMALEGPKISNSSHSASFSHPLMSQSDTTVKKSFKHEASREVRARKTQCRLFVSLRVSPTHNSDSN
jgi:hypothetical protein